MCGEVLVRCGGCWISAGTPKSTSKVCRQGEDTWNPALRGVPLRRWQVSKQGASTWEKNLQLAAMCSNPGEPVLQDKATRCSSGRVRMKKKSNEMSGAVCSLSPSFSRSCPVPCPFVHHRGISNTLFSSRPELAVA